MILIFSDNHEPITKLTNSIFLAGPSPRKTKEIIKSTWRHEAIAHLKDKGYEGHVFIPMTKAQFENGDFNEVINYDDQLAWEDKYLNAADFILFWIPRSDELPGYTTNIEFGRYLESFKVIYGRPKDAPHTSYIDELAKARGIEIYDNLESIANDFANTIGILREGVNCYLPAKFYKFKAYQTWYNQLVKNGHILESIKVTHVAGNIAKCQPFIFTFKSSVYLPEEERHKDLEEVLIRDDLTLIVPYFKDNGKDYVVMTSEYRQSVCNELGTVLEFPSGGLSHDIPAFKNAQKELYEETNIIAKELTYLGSHQIYATLIGSRVHIYSHELDKDKIAMVKDLVKNQQQLGENADERITLSILDKVNFIDSMKFMDTLTIAAYHLAFR